MLSFLHFLYRWTRHGKSHEDIHQNIVLTVVVQTIIEADGENTKPLVVDRLEIHPGQRYSVVVETNKPVGNYWIRSNPNRGPQGNAGGLNSAIFRYEGADAVDPADAPTPPPSTKPFREQDLRALTTEAGLDGPATSIVLPITAQAGGTFGFGPTNGSFVDPPVPVLLQILNGRPPTELLPTKNVQTLQPNTLYELTIPGGSPGSPVSIIAYPFDRALCH